MDVCSRICARALSAVLVSCRRLQDGVADEIQNTISLKLTDGITDESGTRNNATIDWLYVCCRHQRNAYVRLTYLAQTNGCVQYVLAVVRTTLRADLLTIDNRVRTLVAVNLTMVNWHTQP